MRGELLDESLEILQELLTGNALLHAGRHYAIDSPPLLPAPVQDPVPIWAAVRWPNRKPLARAATLQGCFPIFPDSGDRPAPPPADELMQLQAELTGLGAGRFLDVAVRCALHRLPEYERAGATAALADAGVTWLLEAFAPGQDAAAVEAYVRGGPPGG